MLVAHFVLYILCNENENPRIVNYGNAGMMFYMIPFIISINRKSRVALVAISPPSNSIREIPRDVLH